MFPYKLCCQDGSEAGDVADADNVNPGEDPLSSPGGGHRHASPATQNRALQELSDPMVAIRVWRWPRDVADARECPPVLRSTRLVPA